MLAGCGMEHRDIDITEEPFVNPSDNFLPAIPKPVLSNKKSTLEIQVLMLS